MYNLVGKEDRSCMLTLWKVAYSNREGWATKQTARMLAQVVIAMHKNKTNLNIHAHTHTHTHTSSEVRNTHTHIVLYTTVTPPPHSMLLHDGCIHRWPSGEPHALPHRVLLPQRHISGSVLPLPCRHLWPWPVLCGRGKLHRLPCRQLLWEGWAGHHYRGMLGRFLLHRRSILTNAFQS